MATAKTYNDAELRVLQHAADILGVSCDVLQTLGSEPKRPPPPTSPLTRIPPTVAAEHHPSTAVIPRDLACNGHHGVSSNAEWTSVLQPFDEPDISAFEGPVNSLDYALDHAQEGSTHDALWTGANFDFPLDWASLSGDASLLADTLFDPFPLASDEDRVHLHDEQAGLHEPGQQGMAAGGPIAPPAGLQIDVLPPVPAEPNAHQPASPVFNASQDPIQPQDATQPPLHANKVLKGRDGNKVRQRRRFDDPTERHETARTRKIGACILCAIQKTRCIIQDDNLSSPCQNCLKNTTRTFQQLPCIRWKIVDAVLTDKGPKPQAIWTSRWNAMQMVDIDTWASDAIKTIKLTHDVGGTSYEFRMREFLPLPGDALSRKWKTNGIQMAHECTPYAVANMRESAEVLKRYNRESIDAFLEFYIDKDNEILYETYMMAREHSKTAERDEERQLLEDIFRFWVAMRMETRSERICGSETLGIAVQDYDPSVNSYGHVTPPPMLAAQLEIMTSVALLRPLRRSILQQLEKMIKANRTKYWFALYLSLFVLLHSCSLLTAFQQRQARKYGLETRYIYNKIVADFHHGAKILLAYFHVCNKGSQPFALSWDSPANVALAELSSRQTRFLQRTNELVELNRQEFKRARDECLFEHDFFFLAQLFEDVWIPVDTIS